MEDAKAEEADTEAEYLSELAQAELHRATVQAQMAKHEANPEPGTATNAATPIGTAETRSSCVSEPRAHLTKSRAVELGADLEMIDPDGRMYDMLPTRKRTRQRTRWLSFFCLCRAKRHQTCMVQHEVCSNGLSSGGGAVYSEMA